MSSAVQVCLTCRCFCFRNQYGFESICRGDVRGPYFARKSHCRQGDHVRASVEGHAALSHPIESEMLRKPQRSFEIEKCHDGNEDVRLVTLDLKRI